MKANAKLPVHGASVLPSVSVESYNLEIKDNGGFVGDKASKSAFARILKKWVDLAGEAGREPLGNIDLANPDKDKLAALLADGDPDAASLVMSALAEYSHELAAVLKRYLRLKEWKKVSSVVVGGGFMANRLGQMAIAHTEWLLRAEGIKLNLLPIRNDPDEAALLGGVHLLPPWMFASHKAMLAVDIGGTNIRAGIVKFRGRTAQRGKAKVGRLLMWRHADEEVSREAAARRLVRMLKSLIETADRKHIRLIPLIAIACPGRIDAGGYIEIGGQNLPGNWESGNFNLPDLIQAKIPHIGKGDTLVIMHNDAVVQGLSEIPRMKDVRKWGVLTIGTGLGNAAFASRTMKKGKRT